MASNGKRSKKGATDAIDAGRHQTGSGTATGQEAARRAGGEDLPTGKDKGSTVDPGEVPKKDGQGPIGRQAEPAVFVGNGAVDLGMVASPSGPVPIASVVSTPEEGEKLVEKNRADIAASHKKLTRGRRLSDEEINGMSGAVLRAVATDRGYTISHSAGNRGTRAAFAAEQKKDKNLEK